jgi:ribonuclease HI
MNKLKIYPKVNNKLYFDGCSKGNPGRAGIGAVLYVNDIQVWGSSMYLGIYTNNEAEYNALIFGLQKALEFTENYGTDELIVYGDSQLVINQMKGVYKVNSENLKKLNSKAVELKNKFRYIEFQHIYRKYNKEADRLANLAIIDYLTDDNLTKM